MEVPQGHIQHYIILLPTRREEVISSDPDLLLLQRYRQTGDHTLRNQIMIRHIKLMYWQAKQVLKVNRSCNFEFEELAQVAMVGFMKGLEEFNIESATKDDNGKHVKVVNFCTNWSKQHINRFIENHNTTVKISWRIKKALSIGAERSDLASKEYEQNVSIDQVLFDKNRQTRIGVVGLINSSKGNLQVVECHSTTYGGVNSSAILEYNAKRRGIYSGLSSRDNVSYLTDEVEDVELSDTVVRPSAYDLVDACPDLSIEERQAIYDKYQDNPDAKAQDKALLARAIKKLRKWVEKNHKTV